MEAIGVELAEQPVRSESVRDLRALTDGSKLAVMADEVLQGPVDAMRVAADRSADVFAVKIGQSGGLRRADEVIANGQVLTHISAPALAGLALPPVLATLTGQFLSGMAILQANGYDVAAHPVVALCPRCPRRCSGGFTTALASVTLTLCMAPDAHPDMRRRYAARGRLRGILPAARAACRNHRAVADASACGSDRAAGEPRPARGGIMKSLADTLFPEGSPADRRAGLPAFMVTTSGVSVMGIRPAFGALP